MNNVENIGFPLIVEGTTTGECIILNDFEDNEEVPVLYINSDKYSSACQTEPWDGDVVDFPHIPNIPIFFCTRFSPDLASTQCLIPITVDVAVGLDSSHSALMPRPSEWVPQDNLGTLSMPLTVDPSKDTDIKIEVPETLNVAVPVISNERKKPSQCLRDIEVGSALHHSQTSLESAKTDKNALDTVKVKVKRGRRRKVVCDDVVNSSETHLSSSSQSQIADTRLGKRKRKAKRDVDYEYDICDSEDESKKKIEIEVDDDDDRDEDYKVEKERISSDDEFDFGVCTGKNVLDDDESVSSIISSEEIKVEEEGGDCEPPVSDDEELGDMSECEAESDDDVTYDNLLSNTNKKSKVLTVGINDLNSESEHSKRLRKYLLRAKEKYHQEKVVKDDGSVVYKCLKCDEEFPMRLQLKEHKKRHSTKVRIYDCSHCDKVFTEARKYYSHLGFHDRLFECRSCGRRFSLLRNLKKHLTIHPGAPDQVCEVCGNQFLTTEELKLHHETQHNEDSIKPYKLECKHCGKKYVREEAYNHHISKAPYECSMCDASLGCEFKLKDHIRYEHGHCVCEFCGKSFKKRSLIHHIKIVHMEACVQCPHCPKKFAYRSKMLAHLDANHTDEKKYKCNQCSYTARTVNTLNLHRRRCHSELGSIPRYGCDVCGRKFYLPSKLTSHYRIHTGEKPYTCGSCGKAFASKYNMAEHQRCVHGERMKLVNPDGTSTVRVVKHRRTPRAPGRRCDICGIHLPSSAAILSHMKQHHNAQALPTISLVADKDGGKAESQVAEIELNGDNYEASSEQYEVIENTEQDLILTASSGMVTIPEYATHVEIDGVEYQVLRQ